MRQAYAIGHAVALEEFGMTKLAKKKSDEEQDMYKSPFTRALQVGTGAGILKGNAPFVSALAKGRADLWHGTPIENMFEGAHGPGILSQGLSTEFAGKNKRLNNVLMSNALFRDTEEFMAAKGMKITPDLEKKLFEVTDKFLHDQKSSGLPIHEAIGKIAPEVAQQFGLNPTELGAHYQKRLPELGKRIYFGAKPEAVSFWSNAGKNEKDYIAAKLMNQGRAGLDPLEQVKIMAEGLGEQVTGGYLNDIRAKLQYGKPGKIEDVANLEGLREKLKAHLGSNVNTVFRSSVPTQSLDHLKDLPGARHLLSSLPIVKTIASRFFPQNDPSKDLSIAQNLDPKSINRAEIVDKATGRVTHRYNVGGATKQPFQLFGGAGHRLKNLRKAAIPGLLTAGGASMIYSGLKDVDKDLGFRKKGSLDKFGKVDRATLLKSFLYPAAALAIPGGAAIGARHIMDEKLPDVPTAEKMRAMGLREQLRQSSKEMEYTKKLTIPSALIGAAGGAAMGGAVGPKGAKLLSSAFGAYMGGNVGASYAPYMAQQNTLIKTDPENSGLLGMVLGKRREGRDFLREHPEGVSVGEQALQAGLLGSLPYFVMKKYYPYHAQKIKNAVSAHLQDGLAKVRTPEFQSAMKKWYVPAVGASVALPTAINYGTAAGMQHGLAAAAGEEKKTRKKVAEYFATLEGRN